MAARGLTWWDPSDSHMQEGLQRRRIEKRCLFRREAGKSGEGTRAWEQREGGISKTHGAQAVRGRIWIQRNLDVLGFAFRRALLPLVPEPE